MFTLYLLCRALSPIRNDLVSYCVWSGNEIIAEGEWRPSSDGSTREFVHD